MNSDINKHLEAFNSLDGIESQLNYWCKHLPVNYIDFSLSDDMQADYPELTNFRIHISNAEERQSFCFWIQQNFLHYSLHPNKEKMYLDLGALKARLELELKSQEETGERKKSIQTALKKIDASFKEVPSFLNHDRALPTGLFSFEYNADHKTFRDYVDYEIEPDFKGILDLSTQHILRVSNGFTLAQYRLYLTQRLEEINKQPTKEAKEISLDHRLLVLRYLGALSEVMEAGNNTKQGKFLSYLIRNDFDSIRQRFSSINDLFEPKEKTKKKKLLADLEEVNALFEELGLEKIAKKVRTDIRKLKLEADSKKL